MQFFNYSATLFRTKSSFKKKKKENTNKKKIQVEALQPVPIEAPNITRMLREKLQKKNY